MTKESTSTHIQSAASATLKSRFRLRIRGREPPNYSQTYLWRSCWGSSMSTWTRLTSLKERGRSSRRKGRKVSLNLSWTSSSKSSMTRGSLKTKSKPSGSSESLRPSLNQPTRWSRTSTRPPSSTWLRFPTLRLWDTPSIRSPSRYWKLLSTKSQTVFWSKGKFRSLRSPQLPNSWCSLAHLDLILCKESSVLMLLPLIPKRATEAWTKTGVFSGMARFTTRSKQRCGVMPRSRSSSRIF